MKCLHEIDLNITNRCNLKCQYCVFSSKGVKQQELSLNQILDLIYQAHRLGVEDIHFTGGEPTLRDDLVDMVRFASKLNINTRLITNGTLLNEYKLQELKKAGLNKIMISLDGFEDTNDFMRGMKGAFNKAISTVKTAIKLGFNVRVNSVATKNNIKELISFSHYLNEMDISTYSIFLFSPAGRGEGHKDILLDSDTWLKFSEEMKIKCKNYKMEVIIEKGYQSCNGEEINKDSLIGPGGGCSRLLDNDDYLIITSDGKVWPCILLIKSGLPFGNIQHQSLFDIIKNKKNIEFYAQLSKPYGLCKECNVWEKCLGGCKGYSKLLVDNWFETDPRCLKNINRTIDFYPLCPIMKFNCKNGKIGGSSEQVSSYKE